jgi:V8-like Glu-specific endopeptidase
MSDSGTGTRSPQEQEALDRLRQDIADAERTGRPIFVPDLAAIGLRPPAGGAESLDGATTIDYSEALESICGVVDDSQGVETYDGTLGVTQQFVADHQRQVACVVWNDDLADHFANPGNVAGAEFGSGTMVSDDVFLTCGHLFDQTGGGWVRPVDDATGTTITPQQIATHMHLRFDYQDQPDGTPRPTTDVPILELLEYRLGGIDMAVCRVPAGTGATFGRTAVSSVDAAVGDMIAIIGHPLGVPKRIEAGPATELAGNAIRYDDIDTQGGNSGSGIVSAVSGAVVGVHTNGGCTTSGTGANSGQRIGAILDVSPVVRDIALGGT